MALLGRHLLFLSVIVLYQSVTQAMPPPGYIGESAADVVEVKVTKRSPTSGRKFRVNYGSDSVELDLVRSDGFLPKTLQVHVLGSDKTGNRTIDDWTHTTGEGKEIYVDMARSASVIIDDENGPPQIRGRLGEGLVIEPSSIPNRRLQTRDESLGVRHTIYRVKVTKYPTSTTGPDVELVPEVLKAIKRGRPEKRQQISQIYVPLHIVINYDYYKLMGSDVTRTVQYVKTYFAAINAYFGLITNPKVQLSIQAIDIFKTLSEAQPIEQHRFADGGLVAGEVLKTFRKWAFNERSRIGESYAGLMIMTGTKIMCSQPHGPKKDQCKNIAGLAYGGAGCAPFGSPLPGETFRVGIALDDYAYSGVIATTHEVGHLLGMSHDGSPADYPGGASAASCSFTDFYIMGQQNYIKIHTKWSDCSIRQLQYWVQSSGKATCVKSPPAPSSYGFDSSTLTVHNVQKQCQLRHGPSASFPSFCQKIDKVNEEVCFKLMCFDSATQQCKFGYGAAPGTPCGPDGQICYQGACQNPGSLGITQASPGAVNPGRNPPLTSPTINPPTGCTDNKGISFQGNNCEKFLSGSAKQYACDWDIVTKQCCASKAKYCKGGANPAPTQNPGNTGCSDSTAVSFGKGETCAQFLSGSGKQFACDWPSVVKYCCASKAKHCTGGAFG